MGFEEYNLNSPARQKLWSQYQAEIEEILEQVKAEVFEGNASIKRDYVAPFSGLAKPNLSLGPTGDLRGFIGICVSPKDEDSLRVLASNGHTASRYDTQVHKLEEAVERALARWLSQPMYKPEGAVLPRG
jgi:hypothetical protein